MKYAYEEMNDGSNDTPKEELLQLSVTEIVKVVDGDTIDVVIDLGFDIYKHERVRIAGIDTLKNKRPEEKKLGIDATNWMKGTLEDTINGNMNSLHELNLKAGLVSMVVSLVGYMWVKEKSLNEKMIDEGYAWCYDGGTKRKDFESLKEIRSQGTLIE